MASIPLFDQINKNDNPRLNGLDHLRAFAICYVVLFHYRLFGHPAWIDKVGSFGWSGVDLFFVLSGYLIAGELFKSVAKDQSVPLKEFFVKRFFRIVPPYLVVLGLYFFIPAIREREHMAPLWRYLTFTTNFGLDVTQIGTFTHSWSLCVEEQFYLVLPLTILLLKHFRAFSKGAPILLGVFACGFVIRWMNWELWLAPNASSEHFGALYNEYIYYPTYNRLDSLIAGVSVAALYSFYPKVKQFTNDYCNIIMLSGSVVLVAAYYICTPQQTIHTAILGYPIIAIGYGLIVAAIVCPSNMLYNFKSWITYQIATLSYSIYLVHKLAIHITQAILSKLGVDVNSTMMMVYCIGIIVLAAIVLRYAIEKPSMLIRHKLIKTEQEKPSLR